MDESIPQSSRRWIFCGWCVVVLGILIIGRWSVLTLPHEVYPDETQLLSGAITLRHDALFWRAVDGHTAGPLDFYALLPATLFQGPAAYVAARVIAALMVAATLIATGEAIAQGAGFPLARLAILPALAFEALTTSPEFFHYSTELVPCALLALAVWSMVRQSVGPSRFNLVAAALLLGLCPYAKLQAAPIAAVLGLILLVSEVRARRERSVSVLVGSALLPTLVIVATLTLTGQIQHFAIPYLLQNTLYASTGRLPTAAVVAQQIEQSLTNGYHAWWLGSTLFFALVALLWRRKFRPPIGGYVLAVVALTTVTVVCVLSPGRPYHHYLNFLTLPVTLWGGIALAVLYPAKNPTALGPVQVVVVFLACTLVPQLALWLSPRPDPYVYYNTIATAPTPAQLRLVGVLKRYSEGGDTLGLWGWRSSLYVEADLRQATREAHTAGQFVTGPWQGYYLKRYFNDLVAAAPPVFADAAGPGNFWFNARRMGHEIFPQLREWIAANYTEVEDLDGVRIYVRRDRWQAVEQRPKMP